MIRALLSTLAAAAIVSTASLASAQPTVEATHLNVDPALATKITLGATNYYVWAGVNNWDQTGGTFTDLTSDPFQAFCIEIPQTVAHSSTWTVTSLDAAPQPSGAMGLARAEQLGKLWGGFYSSIGTSDTLGAAFQLAVWEIVHETSSSYDVYSGNFYARNQTAARDQANTWLSQLDSVLNPEVNLIALTNPTYQDFMTLRTSPGTPVGPATPLPSSVLAGSLLLGGVGLLRRWRRRTADL